MCLVFKDSHSCSDFDGNAHCRLYYNNILIHHLSSKISVRLYCSNVLYVNMSDVYIRLRSALTMMLGRGRRVGESAMTKYSSAQKRSFHGWRKYHNLSTRRRHRVRGPRSPPLQNGLPSEIYFNTIHTLIYTYISTRT